ncbi:MAG: glycosyltransferase [Bacteroidales bacterium]|nr:glycosyltransferase [Bacteroidales bacterium]
MDLLIVIILTIYLIFFLYLYLYLFKKNKIKHHKSNAISISVLIAIRNESINIPRIFNQLNNQKYSGFEIVMVDDHSEDNTIEIVESKKKPYLKLYSLPENIKGKKNAILYGLRQCSGEWVVLTDADTEFSHNWLETLNSHMQQADILIAPVLIRKNIALNFLNIFETIDVVAMQLLSYATVKAGMPFLASGANMAIKKDLAIELYSRINTNICSGDDVFLLHEYLKMNNNVMFITHSEAFVYVRPQISWKDFLKQRIRWASKVKYYRNFSAIFFSWLIFLVHFLPIIYVILSFIFDFKLMLLLIMLLAKFIIDFIFILRGFRLFQYTVKMLWYFPIVWFIYFIYISFVPIIALFSKVNWKNRKWR